MKENLLRFNFNQKYLVLDTETEGLNLLRSRPYQIAWLEAVGKKIVARHERYIWWPDLNMSDGAAKINKFDYEKYRDLAKPARQVWDEFCPLLDNHLSEGGTKIIGQNFLGFDAYMLNSWPRALGLNSSFNYIRNVLDTKAMAMAIAKGCKTVDEDDLIYWQYRWLNHREKNIKTTQAHLLKHYEIPHDPEKLHDALYDIEMTFQIFQKQIIDLEI